jgi:hypothetical protein
MNVNKQEVFRFLDFLREDGSINMFGAGPYIQESFGVNRNEAKTLLLEWMDTFSERVKKGEVQA